MCCHCFCCCCCCHCWKEAGNCSRKFALAISWSAVISLHRRCEMMMMTPQWTSSFLFSTKPEEEEETTSIKRGNTHNNKILKYTQTHTHIFTIICDYFYFGRFRIEKYPCIKFHASIHMTVEIYSKCKSRLNGSKTNGHTNNLFLFVVCECVACALFWLQLCSEKLYHYIYSLVLFLIFFFWHVNQNWPQTK